MRDRRAMLRLNQQQKAYYESRFAAAGGDERAANRVTNLWTSVRRRIQRNDQEIGTQERILDDHRRWLGDLGQASVLDLGCFTGNQLSLWIAARARRYRGIDLSEGAVGALQDQLDAALPEADACAVVGDFLTNDFPDEAFDVVYAHSVLHHFEEIDVVLAEIERVLKPGGIVVSLDPLATEPLNQMLRAAYRPFQSDRDWEWPFRRKTFRGIRRRFHLDRVQGYRGFSMLSFPLALLPFMAPLARRAGRAGLALERRWAAREGAGLWLCWMVSTCFSKPMVHHADDSEEPRGL